jgi:uncharacterized protein (DUF486 family)
MPAGGAVSPHSRLTRAAAEFIFSAMDMTSSRWLPIVLLTCSNVFMTFAWYGHLKHKDSPLWLVIFVSWGIAFFEYCFQVPANRWGSNSYSPYQLKIMQEAITLVVFVVFAFFYFKTWPAWNHIAAFVCILAAVAFAFWPKA